MKTQSQNNYVLYPSIKNTQTMKQLKKQLSEHSKTRITFFDLFGGGQKVIADFYSCATDQDGQKTKQTNIRF